MQAQKTSSSKQKVAEVVDAVIAEHGFYGIIHDLLETIQRMAAISLADPDNRTKERQYRDWSDAVRAACKRQEAHASFDGQITDADALRARALGISLA
jgi:hypothetical protein